jgi:hypothetical protein
MGNGATPESLPRLPSTLLKTKGGCGKLEDEAGISQKIKDLFVLSGNVIERKGVIISW